MSTITRKILAVDGVEGNLEALKKVFREEPYEIVTARTAEDALEVARRECPDVAILGVRQPGVDGFDLCRKFRESLRTSKMSIVFTSGENTSSSEAVEALDVGGCDYIAKPFEAEELRARVRAVLRIRSENEQDIETTRTITRRLARP